MTLDEPLVGGIAARLHQTHTWTARGDNGALIDHGITDMTPRHQARVLAWLRLHADALHAEHRADLDRLWLRGRVSDDVHREQVRAHDSLPAAVWLEETSMVRRLVALVPRTAAPARGAAAQVVPVRADHAQVLVEQRIEDAQEWRDVPHLDPAYEEMLERAQDRYERALGWTHD